MAAMFADGRRPATRASPRSPHGRGNTVVPVVRASPLHPHPLADAEHARCKLALERVKKSKLQAWGRLHSVIPAKERVKKSNAAPVADPQSSFPRKRESISHCGTSCWMDPRLRGDDGPAQNSPCQSLSAGFFTRSKAGIHFSLQNKLLDRSPPSRG